MSQNQQLHPKTAAPLNFLFQITVMIARRLLLIAFILFAIISLTYGMIASVKGDALVGEKGLSEEARAKKVAQYKEKHNYGLYLKNIIQLDLGTSYTDGEKKISEILRPAIPVSFALGGLAITLSLIWGISTGILSAHFHNTRIDRLSMLIALVGLSVPAFILGPLFQYYFGFQLKWLEISKWWHPFQEEPEGSWKNIILPSITLAAVPAASIARIMRSSLLDALHQDYMRTALSKGLGKFSATIKHGFRNAILPILSYLGPAAAAILMGSIVVEKIFLIPGLGNHFIENAKTRDREVVLGIVLLYSTLLLFFNLVVDILYRFVDPRIKE